MRVQCVKVEYRRRSLGGKKFSRRDLFLDAVDGDGRPVSLVISDPFRGRIGILSELRRRHIAETCPPEVELISRNPQSAVERFAVDPVDMNVWVERVVTRIEAEAQTYPR